MTRTVALLAATAVAAGLAVVPSAQAKSWSTGPYVGKSGAGIMDLGPKKRRGKVRFTVTRKRIRADRLTVVLRCTEGGLRRFTIRGAGSARLKEGPAGAGWGRLSGKRTIDGYAVDWSLTGGIHGSRLRSTIDVFADAPDGVSCGMQGTVIARRR